MAPKDSTLWYHNVVLIHTFQAEMDLTNVSELATVKIFYISIGIRQSFTDIASLWLSIGYIIWILPIFSNPGLQKWKLRSYYTYGTLYAKWKTRLKKVSFQKHWHVHKLPVTLPLFRFFT
jgi:hypothetical protein